MQAQRPAAVAAERADHERARASAGRPVHQLARRRRPCAVGVPRLRLAAAAALPRLERELAARGRQRRRHLRAAGAGIRRAGRVVTRPARRLSVPESLGLTPRRTASFEWLHTTTGSGDPAATNARRSAARSIDHAEANHTHRLDAVAAVQDLHVVAEPENVDAAVDFPGGLAVHERERHAERCRRDRSSRSVLLPVGALVVVLQAETRAWRGWPASAGTSCGGDAAPPAARPARDTCPLLAAAVGLACRARTRASPWGSAGTCCRCRRRRGRRPARGPWRTRRSGWCRRCRARPASACRPGRSPTRRNPVSYHALRSPLSCRCRSGRSASCSRVPALIVTPGAAANADVHEGLHDEAVIFLEDAAEHVGGQEIQHRASA